MNAAQMIERLGSKWTQVSGREDRIQRRNDDGTWTQITSCPKGYVVGTISRGGDVISATHHYTFVRTSKVVG